MAVLPSDYNFSKRYTRACDLTIPPHDHSKRSVELRHKAEPQHLQRDSSTSSPAGRDWDATPCIYRHGGLEWRKPRLDILSEVPCPSANSPNKSSTASPPARWSSALRAWSRNSLKTPSTPGPAGSTFSLMAAAGGGSASQMTAAA